MKTRRTILSLLLCGVMLFSLCAWPIFAEAGVQVQNPVNNSETGSEVEPEPADSVSGNAAVSANAVKSEPEELEEPLFARAGAKRAAARTSDIDMRYQNFVFAQGVPIVIRQNGSITSIYSKDDDLLSGDTNVSGYAIYGGWFDGDNEHAAETSVTMESGSISELFGGSFRGTLTGDTSVVVNGGEITNIVCGGGNQSVINGSTRVEIKGGTIGVGNKDAGYVYGGGFSSKVIGSTAITINSGVKIYQAVYGGSNNESAQSTKVVLNGGDVDRIYGGGYEGKVNGATSVEINGGAVSLYVCGGGSGENSTIYGGTDVKVNGGTVGSVLGGGDYGTVAGGTSVTIDKTAQIIGNVYGGGDSAPVDDSRIEINGGTMTSVFGGGNHGTVTKSAVVTVVDGTIRDSVYGGSNEAAAKSTKLVLAGGTVTNQIYGGGFNGSVEIACVELKGGTCGIVYGGGQNSGSTVQQATVTLGADWGNTKQVFAGGNSGAVTNAFQVIIQNYATQSQQSNFLSINAETADNSEIVIRRSDDGSSGSANTSNFNLTPTGVKRIVVEYGEVTLLGQNGLKLQLDSLDIRANGQVRFQDWDTVEIQELSGSGGQLLFPAQFVSGTSTIVNQPVTVGKISATAPLIIKAEGTGWGTNLDDFYFFQGAGVDTLTSTDCFFSEGYEVVLREIPDKGGAKGIYLQKKEAEKPVYISKLEFNQNPVAYNGTISLTVGVGKQLATVDYLELIPSARIQIRGSNDRNVLFADILVSDDGKSATVTGVDGVTSSAQVDGAYITITLPVNADLLDTCKEGLTMIATAPNQYSSTAQLVGPDKETQIKITPTPVTLTKTIPDPDSRDPVEGELEDGAFYTAGFRWHTEDGFAVSAFAPDRDYRADIILAPKEGHWLSAASIGSTVTYDGKDFPCVFNADGTVTLKDVKSVRITGWTVVTAASPAEGGTVTGGGSYASDSQVTVNAQPAEGWHFVKWTEGGIELSGSADYTFTVTGNRTLVAVFEKDDDPTPQPETYTVTVETDGNGTALASPTSAAAGTTVSLTATANSGYHFKEWQVVSGGVTVSEGRFTMPAADVVIKAVFEKDNDPEPPQPEIYTVTVETDGNGTALASPTSATAGTTVSLTATANSGYHFKEWQVVSGGVTVSGGRFTMPAADVVIKAVFEKDNDPEPPQPTAYTVTVNGSYATASGAGSYEAGAMVSIQAGSRSNYRFDRWTSSDGIGFVNAENASTTFIMPDQAVTVTAHWTYIGDNTGGSSGNNTGGSSGNNTGGSSGNNTGDSSGNNTGDSSGNNTENSSGSSSGGSSLHTPSYDRENFTEDGVTLTGERIHEHARLTVTKGLLHSSGACGYCDQIRQWQEQGRVIAIYDVSLSYDFQGTVTLTFPVSGEYNGKTLTVVHCLKDRLDTCDVTVSNGKVTVTVSSLSPFAILDSSKGEPGGDNPDTGAGVTGGTNQSGVKSPQTGDSGVAAWAVSGICALPAALLVRAAVIFKRRRKTKAGTSA